MSRKKKYVNWARYENARENEFKKLIYVLKDVIWSMENPYKMKWRKGEVGKPPHNPRAITLLMILQKYMRLSEREFISVIKVSDWVLKEIDLNSVPSRHSLYLARQRVSLGYLDELNRKLVEIIGNSKIFSVDATGFKNSTRNPSWNSKRKRKDYTKFHALSDTETKALKGFVVTSGNKHESPYFEELIQIVEVMEALLADSGYLSRKNCNLIDKKGAFP
ncbi:MAG: transposase [Candidatus Methanofastidiosia archaeon]